MVKMGNRLSKALSEGRHKIYPGILRAAKNCSHH